MCQIWYNSRILLIQKPFSEFWNWILEIVEFGSTSYSQHSLHVRRWPNVINTPVIQWAHFHINELFNEEGWHHFEVRNSAKFYWGCTHNWSDLYGKPVKYIVNYSTTMMMSRYRLKQRFIQLIVDILIWKCASCPAAIIYWPSISSIFQYCIYRRGIRNTWEISSALWKRLYYVRDINWYQYLGNIGILCGTTSS